MNVPERHLADTRSKKRICAYDTDATGYINAQTVDFDRHDDFDSYCVFEYAVIRAIRLYGDNSAEQHVMEKMSAIHRERLDEDFFAAECVSLSLFTSIAIKNYGESLCKPFFNNFMGALP